MRTRLRTPIGEELQFIVFRVARQEYALGILELERILPFEPPAPVPDPAFPGAGMVGYSGRRVPAVDLRQRWGQPTGSGEDTRLMILNLDGLLVALAVDQVSEVLRVEATAVAPPPEEREPFASGLLLRGERRITVCNASRLLSQSERLALGRVR
jgi:purine-binding chemotaxis protein CheW